MRLKIKQRRLEKKQKRRKFLIVIITLYGFKIKNKEEVFVLRFYRNNSVHNLSHRVAGQGELSVVVTAASGCIALLEASVAVSRDAVLLTHQLTDEGGMMPTLTVSVPEARLSTADQQSVTTLEVRVCMRGYKTVTRRVQVLPNCCSLLQVDMQPLTRGFLCCEGGSALG